MRHITEKLKHYNLKVTPQRIAIYNILINTNKHPSAESIYRQLEPTNPTMSLATVYKTLDTFKKVGLVKEINIGEGSFRYDANSSAHTHFICEDCNDVFDVPNLDSIDQLKEEISQKTNFVLTREQLFFYGQCKVCFENSCKPVAIDKLV